MLFMSAIVVQGSGTKQKCGTAISGVSNPRVLFGRRNLLIYTARATLACRAVYSTVTAPPTPKMYKITHISLNGL